MASSAAGVGHGRDLDLQNVRRISVRFVNRCVIVLFIDAGAKLMPPRQICKPRRAGCAAWPAHQRRACRGQNSRRRFRSRLRADRRWNRVGTGYRRLDRHLGRVKVAARPPDETHPYGHGKAEPIAAVIVAIGVLAAAIGLAIQSVREILAASRAGAVHARHIDRRNRSKRNFVSLRQSHRPRTWRAPPCKLTPGIIAAMRSLPPLHSSGFRLR